LGNIRRNVIQRKGVPRGELGGGEGLRKGREIREERNSISVIILKREVYASEHNNQGRRTMAQRADIQHGSRLGPPEKEN